LRYKINKDIDQFDAAMDAIMNAHSTDITTFKAKMKISSPPRVDGCTYIGTTLPKPPIADNAPVT
jgi:hypothetical protein